MATLKQLGEKLTELRRIYNALPEKDQSREWSKPNGLWNQIRNLESHITYVEEMSYFAAMGIEVIDFSPKKEII